MNDDVWILFIKRKTFWKNKFIFVDFNKKENRFKSKPKESIIQKEIGIQEIDFLKIDPLFCNI